MEALYIKYTKPEINLQITGMGRTLRLLGERHVPHNQLIFNIRPF